MHPTTYSFGCVIRKRNFCFQKFQLGETERSLPMAPGQQKQKMAEVIAAVAIMVTNTATTK